MDRFRAVEDKVCLFCREHKLVCVEMWGTTPEGEDLIFCEDCIVGAAAAVGCRPDGEAKAEIEALTVDNDQLVREISPLRSFHTEVRRLFENQRNALAQTDPAKGPGARAKRPPAPKPKPAPQPAPAPEAALS